MKITKCPQPLNSLTQSSFINQQPIIQGHILKFIKKGNTFKQKGIICFPQQTYGTSEQSPQQFKLSNTLKPKHGYVYNHQNKSQFKYYSQKRYFSIDGSLNEDESKNIHSEDPENQFKFHRKKGRLTEWMDKNGWMNKTTKMMGFERSDKARDFSNRDRLKRIQALKPKINYDNIAAIKPDTKGQYFKTIGTLTSRKMKIRSNRNIQSQKFSQSVESRNIQSSRKAISRQDRETLQKKMLQTAREWSPSRSAKSKCDEFTKTFFQNRLPKFENQINDQKASRQFSWRQNCEQTLEEWYRTTCSSKWVYNKKLDSQEMELD